MKTVKQEKQEKREKSTQTRYITYGLILLVPVFIGLLFAQMYLRAALVGGLVIGLIYMLNHRDYLYEIGMCMLVFAWFIATLMELFVPAEGIRFWVCILRLFDMTVIAVSFFLLFKVKRLQDRNFDSWENPERFYNTVEILFTVSCILMLSTFMAEWILDFIASGGLNPLETEYETPREAGYNVKRLIILGCLLFLEVCAVVYLVKFIVKKGKITHCFSTAIWFLPSIWEDKRKKVKRSEEIKKEIKELEEQNKAITEPDNGKEPWEIRKKLTKRQEAKRGKAVKKILKKILKQRAKRWKEIEKELKKLAKQNKAITKTNNKKEPWDIG
ncbi:MAG: TMEM198/TM7SF3 family protein [Ruminococcus sp.]|nr:TMEM198/TM7SF3 family protein [Ruminococcus sp.]